MSELEKFLLQQKLKSLPESDLRKVLQFVESLSPAQERPRRNLRGILQGLGDVSEEDIAEARKEMWGNFPRELA